MTIGLGHYLSVGAILFTLGILGIFLNRKNIIVILMSIELILLAVNVNLVAFSTFLGDIVGQVDQGVGHRAGPADDVPQHSRIDRAVGAMAVQLRRQAGVAVIEPDHAISALDQLGAETVGPHRQLRADPHDEQDRRIRRIAEVFVEELDVPADRGSASGLHSSLTLAG